MRSDRPRCRCGHIAMVHDHFRDGSDCGPCGKEICRYYRPDRPEFPALTWLRERLARVRRIA